MPHFYRPSSMNEVCHGERLELCRWVLRWVPIAAARSGGVFGRPWWRDVERIILYLLSVKNVNEEEYYFAARFKDGRQVINMKARRAALPREIERSRYSMQGVWC